MPQKTSPKKAQRPPQKQRRQPGRERLMKPRPRYDDPARRPCGRLQGKAALITGGDSGIGRAVAVAFAKEGADVAIVYLEEHEDARETQRLVQEQGRRALLMAGDVGDESFCREAVRRTVAELGKIDVLVNNAAEQHPQERLEKITEEQLVRTFRTNVFSMFFLTRAALPHLKSGASIVNTTSVTAYRGSAHLIDYASTKGAIVSFTRSLAQALADRKIRVNAVAPGPIWTPLIPSTFPPDQVKTFGSDVPMGRAGEPVEVAPHYVFLASEEASYTTGQVLHPNGGEIVNG
ncbi:MAG TPA: SDR family oxidoreductase [Candidatus Eisenbacteria bacterium]|nr:SDR family oxidoreductase [Candidatus Eisenbacteria bacterium]